jgi:hypothetical protein
MSTAIKPALPKPTKKRKNDRKIQPLTQRPGSGVKDMIPVAKATLRAVKMNTLRRPMRSPIQPQKKPPRTAPTPAEIRISADCP